MKRLAMRAEVLRDLLRDAGELVAHVLERARGLRSACAAQALDLGHHGARVRVGLRAQALDLVEGGLRVGGGALGELLEQLAGARLGVGDRAFHRLRVAAHDLVELVGLAGQALQGLVQLAVALLQGGVDAHVGVLQRAGGLHDRLALVVEPVGDAGHLAAAGSPTRSSAGRPGWTGPRWPAATGA